MTRKPKVAVISLGGTIACAPSENGSGLVPTDDPTATIPSPGFDVQPIPWRLTDSTEITFDELSRLAERARRLENEDIDGIVVTQGTDTLDEVAWTLALYRPTKRPMVLTGAMRAPSTPGSDAAANLYAALGTSVLPGLGDATKGLVVVMNNQIHSAKWVQKCHTQNPDAFSSGELGVLGVITEGRPRILRHDVADGLPSLMCEEPVPDIRVALLPASLDSDTTLFEAVSGLGFSGIVVEGVGGGHVSGDMAVAMGKIAERIPVVFAARPRSGAVLSQTYGSPGAELDLLARGCLSAGFLSGPKARILLTLLLRSGRERDEIESLMEKVTMTDRCCP